MANVSQPYSFIMNANFHLIILLTFLTILFFTYIVVITKDHIKNSLDTLIDTQMTNLLQKVKSQDTENKIRWEVVSDLSKILKLEYQHQVSDITEQNERLQWKVTAVIIGFVFISIALGIYWYKTGYTLGLKVLLLENIVTFMFVGIIELFFFQNIASQYVPVIPSDVTQALFERFKQNIQAL